MTTQQSSVYNTLMEDIDDKLYVSPSNLTLLKHKKRNVVCVLEYFQRFGVDILTDTPQDIKSATKLYNYQINDYRNIINSYIDFKAQLITEGVNRNQTIVEENMLSQTIEAMRPKVFSIPISAKADKSVVSTVEETTESIDTDESTETYKNEDESVNVETQEECRDNTGVIIDFAPNVKTETSSEDFEIPPHLIGKARRVLNTDWSKPVDELYDKDFFDAMNLFNALYGNVGSVSATQSGPAFLGGQKFIKMLMTGEFQNKLEQIRNALDKLDQ